MKQILKRSDYLTIIKSLIDIPPDSFDAFMEALEKEHLTHNPNLYDNLYRDVNYITSKYNKKGDGDLVIEDGDFVIEDGDFKITGKTTNLHSAATWCWMRITENQIEKNPTNPYLLTENLATKEKDLFNYKHYTPDYKKELDNIVRQIKRYREGKTTKSTIKEVPVWLNVIGRILGWLVSIIAIVSFAFKPEAHKFIKWVCRFFNI